MRTLLFGLLIVAAVATEAEVRERGLFISIGAGALAETQSGGIASRFRHWTRARFNAARKHWAEHEQWFSECSKQLENLKKSGKRMSYDGQAHFLEQCMRQKH